MERSHRVATATLVLVLALCISTVACGSDDTSSAAAGASGSSTTTSLGSGGGTDSTLASTGSGGGAEPTTTRATSGAEETTTTNGPSSPLEGTWSAPLQTLLAGGGAVGNLSCDGSVRMTFHAGHNTITGGGSCQMSGRTAEASYDSTSEYRTEGDQLIVTNVADNSRITLDGTPIGGGVGPFGNGTVTYAVSGNVLTITSVDPDLGALSQTFTRES